MKIGLGSLQCVIFTHGFDLSNALMVAQLFGTLKSIKFDGNPTILPLPADAPLEVPRIILRTKDERFNLNISPIRLDLFFTNKDNDSGGTPNNNLADVQKLVISILDELVNLVLAKQHAHIPRIALVVNNIIVLDKSSKKYLTENFIKSTSLQNPEEMQLNFLMKKEVSKYKYNEWLRFNTLRDQKNPEKDNALLFVIDINSFSEIDYDFNKETADEFIKACFSLSKTEIEQYTKKGEQNG